MKQLLDSILPNSCRTLIVSAIFFLFANTVAAYFIWNSEQHRLIKARLIAQLQASIHADGLQINIDRALSANYALAALVRQGKGHVPNFKDIATQMLPFYPGVSALGLSPDGIMQISVPKNGNARSTSLNSALNKKVILAREMNQLSLDGPVDLAQGGRGVVSRLPVFLDDDKGKEIFWGFTSVVIRLPAALKPIEQDNLLNRGYVYKLWRIDSTTQQKQVIAASSRAELIEPVHQTLKLANVTWHLSVAPIQGWHDPFSLFLKSLLGLLFSVLLAWVTKLLLELQDHKQKLEMQVVERTREIVASQNHLQSTLDAIPDLLFELDLNGFFYDYRSPRTDLLAAPSELFIGKLLADTFPRHVAEIVMSALHEANQTGFSVGKQYPLQLQDRTCWFELSVSRKATEPGQEPRFILLARDITERKTTEAKIQRLTNLYATLSQCNQAIVRCSSEQELFPQICRDAVQFGQMKMAWIGLVDPVSRMIQPVASFGEGVEYLQDIQISVDPDSPFGNDVTGKAIRDNQPSWCQDYLHSLLNAPWHERGEKFGWGSTASLPLYKNNVAVGSFNLYLGETNAFDEATQNLLVEMAMDISYALERFEAERQRIALTQELRQTRDRMESILGSIDQAIWSIDANTHQILFLSAAAETIYGRPVDEFFDTPQLWLQVVHPDDIAIARQVAVSGEGEYRIIRPDGELRWVHDRAWVACDDNGKMIRLDGTVSDITERKLIEENIRERDARYRVMFQANPIPMWVFDLQTLRFLAVNDAAINHYGFTKEQFLSMTIVSICPVEDIPKLREALAHSDKSCIDGAEVWRHRKLDGTLIDVEITCHNLNFGGVNAQMVLAYDISARLKTEAQLKLAAKVFKQSSEGFVITDADCNIISVNQAFTNITGYSEAEVIGQNPRILSSGYQNQDFYVAMWESMDRQGYWQGEIWNRRKDGHIYPEWLSLSTVVDANGKITEYIGTLTDITERKASEEHIRRLAHFDPLTGLPNRTLLIDRVNQAISMAFRSQAPLVVMYLDLDHFKTINDSLGHRIGDELLIAVAGRMTMAVREEDTVSRQGGDEFILILSNTDANGAAHVAEKLLAAIIQPYQIGQHELVVTPSIGIAIYPGDGNNFEALSQCADLAMYRAKHDGRNCYRFFTAEMQERSARILKLENALRRALDQGQLTLHYQPQISLHSGQVIGAEALLRWRHPEWGMISPEEFIPIAEDRGQIMQIGEWVLRTAARQLKTWMASGLAPMIIAVNLSAMQFRQAGLPMLVARILDEEQLPAHYLELELTESAAMNDPIGAIAVIDKMFECGIGISIDDFGTGYSSLSYLKRFKINKLKIDQSFVRDLTEDPDDKAIVTAIIQLSRSLGFQTIAEGVETEGQLAFLREQGCDEVQGYYFSKPLTADRFEQFVRERISALTNCN
ncbi:MAG: EAL domain-containing protein [Methylococcaceae bacterium]